LRLNDVESTQAIAGPERRLIGWKRDLAGYPVEAGRLHHIQGFLEKGFVHLYKLSQCVAPAQHYSERLCHHHERICLPGYVPLSNQG
jgi:hypothetical protein